MILASESSLREDAVGEQPAGVRLILSMNVVSRRAPLAGAKIGWQGCVWHSPTYREAARG